MSTPPTLTRVHRLDSITLDKTFFTEEGYLVDEPVVTSVGIFEYRNPDGTIRRELRLPEHVFDKESLASYEGKPVIITHDAGRVDKRNVEREIVGTILSEGYEDGNDVRAKIIIHGIEEVKKSGLRELSLGYDLALDETPGEWHGQKYDAVQTEIRINHLALVSDARAGDQARLNLDSNQQFLEGGKSAMKLKQGEKGKGSKAMDVAEIKRAIAAYKERRRLRQDGEDAGGESNPAEANADSMLTGGEINTPEIATEPEDSIEFIKNRRDRRDQEGDPKTPEEAMAVIAQQDEDISKLIEMFEALKGKSDFDSLANAEGAQAAPVPEGENEDEGEEDEGKGGGVVLKIKTDSVDVESVVQKRLQEAMKLARIGDQLNLDGLEEMKPLDAKKAVIKKVLPAMRLDGQPKSYINAAFDAAVAKISETGTKDCNHQRRQMSNRMDGKESIPTGKTAAARSRERMIERMMNGGEE